MSWYSYEDAREQKEQLQREIARRIKKGDKFEVLPAPEGSRKLVQTFWGQAWCRHLESYSEYESRLPRGRSYLRQGHVYNLAILPGQITATVAGSALYEVAVTIQPLPARSWAAIKQQCAGQVASLLDLLAGKLGDGVLRTISDPQSGLFPQPREIRFSCSCPDYVDLCKHTAAVLYGIGVRFDTAPELFFHLRSVDPAELIATREKALEQIPATEAALANEDLSALFGIDLAPAALVEKVPAPIRKKSAVAKKKPLERAKNVRPVERPKRQSR